MPSQQGDKRQYLYDAARVSANEPLVITVNYKEGQGSKTADRVRRDRLQYHSKKKQEEFLHMLRADPEQQGH